MSDNPYVNNLLLGGMYGSAGNGAMPGANLPSGANYGPTAQGYDGLSPGRSTGLGVVGSVAGLGIPGAGVIGGLGNAFNGGVLGAQLGDAAGQLSGQPAGYSMGNFLGGMFGANPDYGATAMSLGMGPDEAADRLAAYAATGSVNVPVGGVPAAMNLSSPFSAQGGGATSTNSDVAVSPSSAAAFGASISDPSMAQDSAGVNMMGGQPSSEFGDTTGAGDTSAQGGSGQAGGGSDAGASSGQGGNSDAGASGGDGANGGGGDNGGGWKDGGLLIPAHHDFHKASGMAHPPEGVVKGPGGPRDDAVHAIVAQGGYVLPADVVAKVGGGDAVAGARMIATALPKVPMKQDAGEPMPARLSAGEFYVHPQHVAALGGGSEAAGVARLDAMVGRARGDAAQQ